MELGGEAILDLEHGNAGERQEDAGLGGREPADQRPGNLTKRRPGASSGHRSSTYRSSTR